MRRGFYINIYEKDGIKGSKSFFVPGYVFKLLSVFLFIFLGWFAFCTYVFIKRTYKEKKIIYYREENKRLKKKMEHMEEMIGRLKEKIASLIEKQNKLRKYVDFEPIDKGILNMPVGGTPVREDRVRLMEEKLDYLLNVVKKEEENLENMRYFLERNEKLRNSTPSIRPVNGGYITSKFEWRKDPFTGRIKFHKGIDIAAAKGTPIFATADGVVRYSGWKRGYGLTVEIDHGNGFVTIYAHNEKNLVRVGERVKRGDIIALMGRTGKTTGVHVHYEVKLFGKPVNPLLYIIPDAEYFD